MVHLMVLDVNPAAQGVPNNNAKGEKMIPEPSISSAQRRKLADISNLQEQAKVMNQEVKLRQQNIVLSSKEYTERLQKENMTLMKVLAERNKIIELSGIELQKLRINLQKMQEQNFQLAQANSQMLAELNTNKDRLKALQHELGCKNGLLKTRKMQLEEQTIPTTHHASQDEVGGNVPGGACESFHTDDVDHKNTKRKRQSRIKSSGSSIVQALHVNEKASNKRRVSVRKNSTNAEVIDSPGSSKETRQTEESVDNEKLVLGEANPVKEKVHNKRHYVRRQSTSSDCLEAEKSGKLHEMGDAKVMEENARPLLRRQSARLKSEAPESSENLHQMHELKETTKDRRTSVRRQSMRINFQEPDPNGELSDVHDAQETTGDARCSIRGESVGSKSEAVQPAENLNEVHVTMETTRNRRTSTTRQSRKYNPQGVAAADGIIDQKSTDASFSSEVAEECNPLRPSDSQKDNDKEPKNTPGDDETEGTRRISVGRPSRHAAGKIQSYKEVSLKVKMRRTK